MAQIIWLGICMFVLGFPNSGLSAPKSTRMPAAEKNAVVLRVEQDYYGQFEQHALIFNDKTTTVSLNANFLCRPQDQATLGAFRRLSTPHDQAAKKEAAQIEVRSAAKHTSEPELLDPRVYVGPHELTASSVFRETIIQLVANTCNNKDLTPLEGITVQLQPKGRTQSPLFRIQRYSKNRKSLPPVLLSASKAGCQEMGPRELNTRIWSCDIEEFGRVILEEKL